MSMNELEDPAGSPKGDPDKAVDEWRRKFSSAGVAGTGVILTLASRSAMGGWGTCTGSELASTNLSRQGDANPCGCSPGYWWNTNGFQTWTDAIPATYQRTKHFNSVFGNINYFNPSIPMSDCGPGTDKPRAHLPGVNGLDNVAMHAVAALLNAQYYGARFPVIGLQNPLAVISAFQAAVAANTKQALKDFVARVDVYGSSQTWCAGKQHSSSGTL